MEMGIASWFFSAYNGIASEIRSRGRIRMLPVFPRASNGGCFSDVKKKDR
jgi:hypothetical protein